MAEENSLVTTTQSSPSYSVMVSCRWTHEDRVGTCGAEISYDTIPTHFRQAHDIKDLQEGVKIYCYWEGCQRWITRKSFVRHVRERHLGHHRRKKPARETEVGQCYTV